MGKRKGAVKLTAPCAVLDCGLDDVDWMRCLESAVAADIPTADARAVVVVMYATLTLGAVGVAWSWCGASASLADRERHHSVPPAASTLPPASPWLRPCKMRSI